MVKLLQLTILAHTRQVDYGLYSQFDQVLFLSDSGQHEKLRRVERSGGEDDLLSSAYAGGWSYHVELCFELNKEQRGVPFNDLNSAPAAEAAQRNLPAYHVDDENPGTSTRLMIVTFKT